MKTEEHNTREKLLTAAEGIYALHGSRGMTTRLVAREAGVSELTLFRHFGNKQGLLDALAERFSRPEDLEHLFDGADHDDVYEDLCVIAGNVVEAMRQVQRLIRVQLMEVAEHPEQEPFLAVRPRAALQSMSAYFAYRQDTGEVGPGDPMMMAHVFLAFLFARTIGAPMFKRILPQPDDVVIRAFVRNFVDGVKPRPEVS